MSIEAVDRIRDVDSLRGPEKFVLWVLADHANGHFEAWPSVDRLARLTCQSRTTVIRALRGLKTAGAITERPRGRGKAYTISDVPAAILPVRDEGATGSGALPVTGSGERPVAESDRSFSATGTGSGERPVPVAERYPNRHRTVIELEHPPQRACVPTCEGAPAREAVVVVDPLLGDLLEAIGGAIERGLTLNGKQTYGIRDLVADKPGDLPRLIAAAKEAEVIRKPLGWVRWQLDNPTPKRSRDNRAHRMPTADEWEEAARDAERHNRLKGYIK